ncbi:MAG: hypothetical protein PHF86_05030 [Candidatus Nanoarchaeia archaeon]|nr:hypothetical protein [Candidatus Nanoarchaeia archaeon]
MDTKMRAALKAGIEEYSGAQVQSMQVHLDPQVPGTYAIRTRYQGEKEYCDWLIVGYFSVLSAKEISHKLDECKLATCFWQP